MCRPRFVGDFAAFSVLSETFVKYVDVFNGDCLLAIISQFDFVMNFCFLYISSFCAFIKHSNSLRMVY